MALVRWEPVRELTSLQNEMNRLFTTFFDTPTGGNGEPPRAVGSRRWTWSRPTITSSCKADLPGLAEGDVTPRGRGQRPDRLGRAQGRARGQARGLRARRARLRRVPPLADPARGHRSRGGHRQLRQGRSRGPHPEARGAQAAPRCHPGGRSPGGDRGQRVRVGAHRRPAPSLRARARRGPAVVLTRPGLGFGLRLRSRPRPAPRPGGGAGAARTTARRPPGRRRRRPRARRDG